MKNCKLHWQSERRSIAKLKCCGSSNGELWAYSPPTSQGLKSAHAGAPHPDIEPLAGGTRVPRPPAAIAITAAPAGAFLTGLVAAVGPASRFAALC
jgi:hypothetical protein